MGEVGTSTRPCLARDVLNTGTSLRNSSAVSGIRDSTFNCPPRTLSIRLLTVLAGRTLVDTLHVVEPIHYCGSKAEAANGKVCSASTSSCQRKPSGRGHMLRQLRLKGASRLLDSALWLSKTSTRHVKQLMHRTYRQSPFAEAGPGRPSWWWNAEPNSKV